MNINEFGPCRQIFRQAQATDQACTLKELKGAIANVDLTWLVGQPCTPRECMMVVMIRFTSSHHSRHRLAHGDILARPIVALYCCAIHQPALLIMSGDVVVCKPADDKMPDTDANTRAHTPNVTHFPPPRA